MIAMPSIRTPTTAEIRKECREMRAFAKALSLDKARARRFFRKVQAACGHVPERSN